MNKKNFLLVVFGLLIMSGLWAQQKNILFIAVDDLKPLIGAYGDKVAITPNLDRLAAMGVSFTNNHCQQAVCAPSRISLLTGLYPYLTEVPDLKTRMRDQNPDILTLPQYFKENGYTTQGMGKIFHIPGKNSVDSISWSLPYLLPKGKDQRLGEPEQGFYQSPKTKAIYAQLRQEAKAKGVTKGKLRTYLLKQHKPATESLAIGDEGYFDGMMTKVAIERLGKLAQNKEPFMLCVGYKKPHLPFVAPQKYWDLYDRNALPLSENQQRVPNTLGMAYHNSGELRNYTDIPAEFGEDGLLNEAKQRELIHGYYACVSYIDAQVGKLLDALEEEDLVQQTMIVLWGDHGWHLGDHGLWNKHSNFEQATRSPLIIVDPDAKKGIQYDSPTEFIDIFPTLCDLAGLEIPKHLQGTSLKPILMGKKKKIKDFAVSQYPRSGHVGFAIRTDRHRFVAWYKDGEINEGKQILGTELYAYQKDPLETQNLVSTYPELADRLQQQLDQFLIRIDKEKKAFKQAQQAEGGNNPSVTPLELTTPEMNLLQNPGFEKGTEGWRTFGNCSIEVDDTAPYRESYALRLEGTKCGANQVLSNLKPETTYAVSAFAKTENQETIVLKVIDHGGEPVRVRYRKEAYGQLTTTFTTGKGVTKAKIVLQKFIEGTGSSWFDQIDVREVSSRDRGSIDDPSMRHILEQYYDNDFYLGATISYAQLGTPSQDVLVSHFNYTVPENAAKQTRVHPQPNIWNWRQIDAILDMALKHELQVRMHGPISPQCSKWAKADHRTPQELVENMREYMTAQCKRFNGHPNIKWMDVVNETVNRNGTWFGPKPDVDKWENPWTTIGSDTDENQTPLYISQAFEIANQYAPDISLVYNQHGGMEAPMWEKVKETILYLKEKGLRVDGIGWQAHLKSNEILAFDPQQLDYLATLIDWAHAHDLDFHVTEIDYKIQDGQNNPSALQKQAEAYANILEVLLSKRNNGVVTYNSWGIDDGFGPAKDKYTFMFNEDRSPKPAFIAVRELLLREK